MRFINFEQLAGHDHKSSMVKPKREDQQKWREMMTNRNGSAIQSQLKICEATRAEIWHLWDAEMSRIEPAEKLWGSCDTIDIKTMYLGSPPLKGSTIINHLTWWWSQTGFKHIRHVQIFIESFLQSLAKPLNYVVLGAKHSSKPYHCRSFRRITTPPDPTSCICGGVASPSELMLGGSQISQLVTMVSGTPSNPDVLTKSSQWPMINWKISNIIKQMERYHRQQLIVTLSRPWSTNIYRIYYIFIYILYIYILICIHIYIYILIYIYIHNAYWTNIDSYRYMIYVYIVTYIYTQKDPKGGFIHQVYRANFEPLQIRPTVLRPPDWCPILRRPAQIHAASDRCFGGEYPEAAINRVSWPFLKKWSLGI